MLNVLPLLCQCFIFKTSPLENVNIPVSSITGFAPVPASLEPFAPKSFILLFTKKYSSCLPGLWLSLELQCIKYVPAVAVVIVTLLFVVLVIDAVSIVAELNVIIVSTPLLISCCASLSNWKTVP